MKESKIKQKKNFKKWIMEKIRPVAFRLGKTFRRIKRVLSPRSVRRALYKLRPREVWAFLRKVHYYYWILIAAVVASLALSVFHYRLSIIRAWQNLGDFWDSLRIYLQVMVSPTLELPEGITAKITPHISCSRR